MSLYSPPVHEHMQAFKDEALHRNEQFENIARL